MKGLDLNTTGAKELDFILCSKQGMGFRLLQEEWNKAAILPHFWCSLSQGGLLMGEVDPYMYNKTTMHLEHDYAQYACWTMKKLFNLRRIGHPFIKKVVVNGDE